MLGKAGAARARAAPRTEAMFRAARRPRVLLRAFVRFLVFFTKNGLSLLLSPSSSKSSPAGLVVLPTQPSPVTSDGAAVAVPATQEGELGPGGLELSLAPSPRPPPLPPHRPARPSLHGLAWTELLPLPRRHLRSCLGDAASALPEEHSRGGNGGCAAVGLGPASDHSCVPSLEGPQSVPLSVPLSVRPALGLSCLGICHLLLVSAVCGLGLWRACQLLSLLGTRCPRGVPAPPPRPPGRPSPGTTCRVPSADLAAPLPPFSPASPSPPGSRPHTRVGCARPPVTGSEAASRSSASRSSASGNYASPSGKRFVLLLRLRLSHVPALRRRLLFALSSPTSVSELNRGGVSP